MATRVLPFTFTIPANTPASAPVTEALAGMDGWVIERIDLEVPPGPSGLVGFQIYNNGVAWIPYGVGQWIIWDDARDSYYLSDQPNASGWSVVGYNTDVQYSHTITLRFHVSSAPAENADTVTASSTQIVSSAPATEAVTL